MSEFLYRYGIATLIVIVGVALGYAIGEYIFSPLGMFVGFLGGFAAGQWTIHA